MIPIRYPEPGFRRKTEEGIEYLFDSIRRKWLVLTPEEWVRQNFVQYLVQEKKYAVTLMAIEKEIQVGELKKRFDILVYDKKHRPWMMVECKAPEIQLNNQTLQQVLRYNITIPVEFLIITNGSFTYGWQRFSNELKLIHELPTMQ